MIIFLAALVFLYHKKEIEEGKNELMRQTSLKKYFILCPFYDFFDIKIF